MGWRAASRPGRPPVRGRRSRGASKRLLDYLLVVAIALLLAVVTARLDRVAMRQVSGEATINDGDSITIAGERIRLRGIDAPEHKQTCVRDGNSWPCGRLARQALVGLTDGRADVTCSGWDLDRYRRLLAVCTSGGVELNRRQVEQGWAVAYGDYADAETMARQMRIGIWSGSFEMPREWRERHGAMAEPEHGLFRGVVNWFRTIFGFS